MIDLQVLSDSTRHFDQKHDFQVEALSGMYHWNKRWDLEMYPCSRILVGSLLAEMGEQINPGCHLLC